MICVAVCPTKSIQPASRINAKGYMLPMEGDMERCKGCRLCELMCPDFAIAVEDSEE